MPDIDLGVATGEKYGGDYNGRVKLRENQVYSSSPKRDVVVSGPQSIELSINTNLEVDHVKNRSYFTTYWGDTKKTVAILDSEGNPYLAGGVTQEQWDGLMYQFCGEGAGRSHSSMAATSTVAAARKRSRTGSGCPAEWRTGACTTSKATAPASPPRIWPGGLVAW